MILSKPYVRQISMRDDVEINFDDYPFNIPAIRNLKTLEFHPDVTFLIGENGSGKSTLLEALAICLGFGAEGGTRNVRFRTADTISNLHMYLKATRGPLAPKDYYFLRAESFYNVATYMDGIGYLDSYGGASLHKCSHGESFMRILINKMRGRGLYLLDEPEAALSPTRQLAAISAIHQLVKENSQFIIATHSPILLSYPRSKIVLFGDGALSEIRYEDTEQFAITRDFLNNYLGRLGILLADD